jgi:hypothetical protein
MLVLNYGHPLSAEQQEQATKLIGEPLDIRAISSQIDPQRPMAELARELADAAGLTAEEWTTGDILLNSPGLAPLAVALTAEIHGRRGALPLMLRLRPMPGAVPPRFEVAEVVDLDQLYRSALFRESEDEAD